MAPRDVIGTSFLILMCVAAAPTVAQSPSVPAFWAALERAGTVEQVATTRAPSALDARVVASLRRLREYELEPRRGTAYRARWDLERALARDPDNPDHHLALALLLRRGPDARVRLDDSDSGSFIDPRSLASAHALRALRTALELDPGLELAAVELARFARERHDTDLLVEADAALAAVNASGEVLLERALIAVEQSDATRALTHAVSAARAGADPGRVAHVRAVALLLSPATEQMGAAAYLSGLESAGEAAIREYHAASAPTFTLSEAAVWDTLAMEARAGWLSERWEIRAALSGVSLAERLGVHYRRLYEAYREFPLYAPLRDAGNMAGMAVLMGEDPRRHGLAPAGLMLTRFGDASWFRWVGMCGYVPFLGADTLSMANPLDAFLPPSAYRPVDATDIMLHEDSRRMRAVDCDNPVALRRFASELVQGERYRPSFEDRLNVETELHAFRAADGAEVVAGITLTRAQVRRLADAAGQVSLTSALAFIDTTAHSATRSEQPLRFLLPDSTSTHVLLAQSAVTPLHGRLAVRVTVADVARSLGAVVAVTHTVPDFSGDALQLSDVVIAPEGAADRLRRGDIGLALAAGRRYRVGETFELYYEVYGLPPDALYSTRIVVAPEASALWRAARQLTGREPDVLTLEFAGRSGEPHEIYGTQELRTIGTATLRPGRYRLQVEISNPATGASVRRDRLFDITEEPSRRER
ncbi:MAG TPA: hypothetical protein VK933_17625 [Longimicrobiales bacterium]|nr:hypothetical protein [Longimicrobiales bacterium]